MHSSDPQTMEAPPTHKLHGRNKLDDFRGNTEQDADLESPILASSSRSVSLETDSTSLPNSFCRRTKMQKTATISIETFDELKCRLASAERLNTYLEASGGLWKENCERLEQELNTAFVNCECSNFDRLRLQKFASPSTLASKNLVLSRAANYTAIKKTSYKLKEEMGKCDMASSLANFSTLFLAYLLNLQIFLYQNFVLKTSLSLTTQKSGDQMINCRPHVSCVTGVDSATPK